LDAAKRRIIERGEAVDSTKKSSSKMIREPGFVLVGPHPR